MTRVLFILTFLVGLALPGLTLAQSTGGGGSTGGSTGCQYQSCDSDPPAEPLPPGVPADARDITPAATKAIVDAVNESNRYCRDRYDPVYFIDCIARAYVRIGKTLPYRSGYGKARNALIEAGTKLHELAIANTDESRPAKVGPTSRRSPPERLRPVVRTPEVNAAAAGIIEGTQLVLLRSASGSDQRRVAYEQVANVVGSTVVLLRSGRRKKRRDGAGSKAENRRLPLAWLGLFASRRDAPPPAGPSPA
ncbi:hypothetical protein [Stagnihabitans tardus]|uniref:Uncharacterized protein n=1 Tax=Stagnihabitans tardus TaxID=2699202 RepID=A0AAE4Y870_9RHOB|nr:hypothetical protein [Stagnihabitans tardus]NBZ87721.1 hypothetical protein [Stagnihabitans tardus]